MPELFFHPDTTEEIKSSFDWYQEQVKGLGYELVKSLTMHLILFNPYRKLGPKWGNIIGGLS